MDATDQAVTEELPIVRVVLQCAGSRAAVARYPHDDHLLSIPGIVIAHSSQVHVCPAHSCCDARILVRQPSPELVSSLTHRLT